MSVDGGLTTCWMVRSGVTTLAWYSWNRFGRQPCAAAKPPRPRNPPRSPPPSPPPVPPAPGEACGRGAVVGKPPLLAMQSRNAACSWAVIGDGRTVDVMVSPPVFTVATMLGTVPVSCCACRVRPAVTEATPGMSFTAVCAASGNVSSVPARKKSWVNFVPGFPSFDRSVITELFSLSSAVASWLLRLDRASASPPLRPPNPPPGGPAAKNPPPFWRPCEADGVGVGLADVLGEAGATVRVTRMSVPTDPSGERTLRWAVSSPADTPTMPITSATPAASPRAVRTVRAARRRSSLAA